MLRCEVLPVAEAPSTVIVKYSKVEDQHLLHEWAALEFLGGLSGVRRQVPRLYAGDRDARLLVMEDLGTGEAQLLGNILEGEDPARAEAALIEFQRALGKLHAGTIGRDGEYLRIRNLLGAHHTKRHRVYKLLPSLQGISAILSDAGISVATGAGQETADAAGEIASPGPFLAFTHGDATPANVLYTESGARFYDLETGDFRHALVDGTYSRIRYLHSVWARRIPGPIQEAMLTAYRTELASGCPEAADDALFGRAFGACSVGWLAALCSMLPQAAQRDRRWGRSTLRQRIIAGLEHFVAVSEDFDTLPALGSTAAEAARRLRETWGDTDCAMGFYQAFQGSTADDIPDPARTPGV